jgi:hypothetical protein
VRRLPYQSSAFPSRRHTWSGGSAEPTEFRDTLINSPVPSNKILQWFIEWFVFRCKY